MAENEIVPSEQPQSLLSLAARLATDPKIDVAKLQAILEMQERLEAREAIKAFNAAFKRLRSRIPAIPKHGSVKYEDKKTRELVEAFKFGRWEDIDATITPLLHDEGFTLSFSTTQRQGDGGGLIVTGILTHDGGHVRETQFPVALDTSGGKNNNQAAGSSLSYGKRNCTIALLNLVFEGQDDDGVRGGMVFLTTEHQEELFALLTETRTDPAAFFEHFFPGEQKTMDDVPDADFNRLANALKTKRERMRAL